MRSTYLPHLATIENVEEDTYDTKTFRLALEDGEGLKSALPGQFVELSVFGAGEAPFCIASPGVENGRLEITVRRVGVVTEALHALGPREVVGVRGPLGNHWPFEEVAGRDILFVGGGIGLPPLQSLLLKMLRERSKFGRIIVLYGARTPKDLLYRDRLREWEKREDMQLLVTVDYGDEQWKGRVGMVPVLFKEVELRPPETTAFLCGPPIMIKVVMEQLVEMGFSPRDVVTTLERYMKCGVGKCNHCMVGDKYVCLDGPVFTYEQILEMLDV